MTELYTHNARHFLYICMRAFVIMFHDGGGKQSHQAHTAHYSQIKLFILDVRLEISITGRIIYPYNSAIKYILSLVNSYMLYREEWLLEDYEEKRNEADFILIDCDI